jgi:hypothetical protein
MDSCLAAHLTRPPAIPRIQSMSESRPDQTHEMNRTLLRFLERIGSRHVREYR